MEDAFELVVEPVLPEDEGVPEPRVADEFPALPLRTVVVVPEGVVVLVRVLEEPELRTLL